MAKNNTDMNNLNGLGEISTIRDILMGDKISVYESRFNELSEKLDALNKLIDTKALESNNHINSLSNQLEKSVEQNIEQRMTMMEKKLNDAVEKLNARIDKRSKNDNARIGKLFIDFGKKLGGE